MPITKPVAYSYERVSSPGRQVEGRGLSRQSDMAADWCKRHGYQLDHQLDLSDAGRSAYKGRHLSHGALGRFLVLAEAGELGESPLLIVEAIDRISRQEPMRALQRVVFALVDAGVRIAALEYNRIYDRESLQGDALIMLVLRCKAAHEYSQRLSRRVRDSWADIAFQQKGGQVRHRAALLVRAFQQLLVELVVHRDGDALRFTEENGHG